MASKVIVIGSVLRDDLFYTGVPGQVIWMPAPQAPLGCPPGLEYLTTIDQVLVQQQIELLEGKVVIFVWKGLGVAYCAKIQPLNSIVAV